MKITLRKLLGKKRCRTLAEQFTALAGGDLTVNLVEAEGDFESQTADFVPLRVKGKVLGALAASGSVSAAARERLQTMQQLMEQLLVQALEKRALARETLERYREINLLYSIGETIGACLDPEEIPRLVLVEANRVIHADVGVVLLPTGAAASCGGPRRHTVGPATGDDLDIRASFGEPGYADALYEASRHVVSQVCSTGQPAILSSPPGGEGSIGAILCAPLKTQERVLGSILLGRTPAGRLERRPVFTASEKKLLMALAGQAAIAVENARLFADVKRQRDAIAAMKNYMDNVFASIASGVITTDAQDQITTMNRAAERILVVKEDEARGQPCADVLPELGRMIAPLINTVRQQDTPVTGYELEPELPHRGQVVLRLHLSPLKDSQQITTGVAIVLDDLTERRQLEQQVQQVRKTFERYVAPRVVEQLLSDPASVQLGGARGEVTTFYADIRGFTAFSEKVEPEIQIEVLNRHLTLAAEAVLAEEGTLDKFIGDAVMAIFNVPLLQSDHVLRAVRAALAMQRAIAEMHEHIPPNERLSFGVGITTGQAVVGNIGSSEIHNYTAIGDSIIMAHRLQTQAKGGQLLLGATAYERVREQVIGRDLGLVQLKGHSEPDLVFEVIDLK